MGWGRRWSSEPSMEMLDVGVRTSLSIRMRISAGRVERLGLERMEVC